MILVADSGSTNTDWVVIENRKIKSSFTTRGFNPYFTTSEKLNKDLVADLPKDIKPTEIYQIFFYGSGCSSSAMQSIIEKGILNTFPNSKIEVNHDLLGAARALFMNETGIALILGTGANTCVYNGKEIVENIPSLGYILGDEGGGDYLGKLFISELLYNNLPKKISSAFYEKYQLTNNQIMQKVYKEDHPNQFLASFSEFIYEYRSEVSIKEIIKKSFDDLFVKHIKPYKDFTKYKIRAVGSVAFYFQDLLSEVASTFDTNIERVEKKPIQELAKFHINLK